MDLTGFAKNAALFSAPGKPRFTGNKGRAGGQLTPYFAEETRRFLEENAKYASNFFEAEMDSVDEEHPEKKKWVRIRVADVTANTPMGTNLLDGWKYVYFESPEVDALPRGTKFWFGDNVWICTNPSNVGSAAAGGVIRRCDAVWGTLDYYGNPVYEPFIQNKQATKANGNSYLQYVTLADNYIDCIMSADTVSRDLQENTRMILGSSAYAVRGLNNSSRERTEDKNSVRTLTFSLYRSEPNEGDDMERGIADAGAFSWRITVEGGGELSVGSRTQLVPRSLRNGEVPSRFVSYLWDSSDPAVLTVDSTGLVTAVGGGSANITCRLAQNPAIETSLSLTAAAPRAQGWDIRIDGAPAELSQYAAVTLTAALWRDGAACVNTIAFTLNGPPRTCYEAVTEWNRLTLTCFYPSEIPLTVTASGEGVTAEKKIVLTGY